MGRPAVAASRVEALACLQRGDLQQAEDLLLQVVDFGECSDADALCDLGVLAAARSDWNRAADLFRRCIAIQPEHSRGWGELGRALLESGDTEGATAALLHARQLAPEAAVFAYRLGEARLRAGCLEEAQCAVNDCRALDESFLPALRLQGWLHIRFGQPHRALAPLREFLEQRPADRDAKLALAIAQWHCGDLEAAVSRAWELIRTTAVTPSFRSTYVSWRLHLSGETRESSRECAEEWGRCVPAVPEEKLRTVGARRGAGKLRVGYVTHEFVAGPAIHFLLPLLAGHDGSAFEVFCYHTGDKSDDWTALARQCVPYWRQTNDVRELARAIADDGIDVLVDVSGHYGLYLQLFQSRHAPVQVTFPNYPGSTGAKCMDYILTDRWVCPAGSEDQYTERAVLLDSGYLPYQPPLSPEISDPPVLSNGYVTFGVLQRPSKMNRQVWAAIARVMAAVPESRLLVHYQMGELDDASSPGREKLTGLMEARGIAGDRLVFRGPTNLADHFELISGIDVALDSFPYNGQTTTCECLWMGVPVVSLTGETHVARVGYEILDRVGMGELAAGSVDEYVESAVSLARQPDMLQALRRRARASMAESTLMNGSVLRDIEGAYRELCR